MRISDRSSDVCSSDLNKPFVASLIEERALCGVSRLRSTRTEKAENARTFQPHHHHGKGRAQGRAPAAPRLQRGRGAAGVAQGPARFRVRRGQCRRPDAPRSADARSEEYTYELESLLRLSDAAFC